MTDSDYAKFVTPTSLEIARVLPAAKERVWQYLVDPELRKLWFCAGDTGSEPGQDFVMDFDHSRISESGPPDDSECGAPIVMEGKIVAIDPPNLLAYEWPSEAGDSTLVTIRLSTREQNTLLHLTHERLVSSDFRRGAAAGWHAHLDLFFDLMNDEAARDFWIHHSQLQSEYDRRIHESV